MRVAAGLVMLGSGLVPVSQLVGGASAVVGQLLGGGLVLSAGVLLLVDWQSDDEVP